MIEKLVRPELREFIPYNANQIPHRIKLDANESPFDLPDAVREKLADYFRQKPQINLYPDTDSIELRKSLAEFWDIDIDGIVVGTGSDQLIQVLVSVFVGHGDRVLCPVPSFGMYKLTTTIAGGIPVEYTLGEDYSYNAEKIISLANSEKAKLVFLCTPNNPTGNSIPMVDIIKVVEACRDCVIVIDEAYAEFSGETAISLTSKYENVVVLRTFSKAYGLAGIRCGYSISCRALALELNKIRPPYNISSVSQLIAKLVLEEKSTTDEQIDYIVKQREYLANQLESIEGVTVYPSTANFLLVKVSSSREVNERLIQKGILVRSYGSSPMLEDCLRITVGLEEENETLLKELKNILK